MQSELSVLRLGTGHAAGCSTQVLLSRYALVASLSLTLYLHSPFSLPLARSGCSTQGEGLHSDNTSWQVCDVLRRCAPMLHAQRTPLPHASHTALQH